MIEQMTVGYSMKHTYPYAKDERTLWKRRGKEWAKPQEERSWSSVCENDRAMTFINSQQLWLPMQDATDWTRKHSVVDGGGARGACSAQGSKQLSRAVGTEEVIVFRSVGTGKLLILQGKCHIHAHPLLLAQISMLKSKTRNKAKSHQKAMKIGYKYRKLVGVEGG